MKPFDLQKAKAGEPVITRDGRPAIIAGHNPNAREFLKVAGWVDDGLYSWNENGRHLPSKVNSPYDLFMAPKKRQGWINLYRLYGEKITPMPIMYSSEDEAKADVITNTHIATIPIEWEE